MLQDSAIHERLEQLFPEDWKTLLDNDAVQPASIDLRIEGPLVQIHAPGFGKEPIRPGKSEAREVAPSGEGRWILRPGILYLLSTIERISVPKDLLARLDGRSSWARVGLRVHATAGFLDPGFQGKITLELDVAGPPVELRTGDSICQVSFYRLAGPAMNPYGSKKNSRYQGQSGVTASREAK
jgi:dCTP deaminase